MCVMLILEDVIIGINDFNNLYCLNYNYIEDVTWRVMIPAAGILLTRKMSKFTVLGYHNLFMVPSKVFAHSRINDLDMHTLCFSDQLHFNYLVFIYYASVMY